MCALSSKSRPKATRTNETGTEMELVTRLFTRPMGRRDLKSTVANKHTQKLFNSERLHH